MNLGIIFLQAAAPAGGQNMMMQLLPFLLIIVVFYFFMIRPQMKRQKELKKYREGLKKGDAVLTTSGIHGRVVSVKDNIAHVEIASGTVVRIEKDGIVMDMTDAQAKK